MSEDSEHSEQAAPLDLWVCFATAVHFLTRVTVSPRLATRDDIDHAWALNRSVVFFPLVGALIGTVTASAMLGFVWLGGSPLLAAVLALALEAYLTGAFHEDAFADTCDALGGGWTREDVLRIMKDSRLGTYGTIALILGVAIRALAMEMTIQHGPSSAFLAIVVAAMFARLAIVVFMATTPPMPDRESQARDVSGTQPADRVLLSFLLILPLAIMWFFSFPGTALLTLLTCGVFLVWYRRMVLRRLGGTTGDTLGASGFLAQLVLLIGAGLA